MIVDTFMYFDEADMLECRLTEIGGIVDLFVVVEADIDHQGNPKPYHLTELLASSDRFDRWADKLRVVRAEGLPTAADNPDPWSREHGQREHTWHGLTGVPDDAVVLHGDLDEIPTRLFVRNVRPTGIVSAGMRFHPFAVDWLHPHVWAGTVATRRSRIKSFAQLRDARLFSQDLIPNAGWHFSWVGSDPIAKLDAFAHPEIAGRVRDPLERGEFMRDGWHVDGCKLTPVEVDRTWPEWIRERRCPAGWFRD